jgi:hypothetical protein
MFGKRTRESTATTTIDHDAALERIHRLVLSLPWVVEQPHAFAAGLRMFVVDCEPLGLRRLWLVTGVGAESTVGGARVEVILPVPVARRAERAGWGVRGTPMPAHHVVVRTQTGGAVEETDALLLAAYSCAMSYER